VTRYQRVLRDAKIVADKVHVCVADSTKRDIEAHVRLAGRETIKLHWFHVYDRIAHCSIAIDSHFQSVLYNVCVSLPYIHIHLGRHVYSMFSTGCLSPFAMHAMHVATTQNPKALQPEHIWNAIQKREVGTEIAVLLQLLTRKRPVTIRLNRTCVIIRTCVFSSFTVLRLKSRSVLLKYTKLRTIVKVQSMYSTLVVYSTKLRPPIPEACSNRQTAQKRTNRTLNARVQECISQKL